MNIRNLKLWGGIENMFGIFFVVKLRVEILDVQLDMTSTEVGMENVESILNLL